MKKILLLEDDASNIDVVQLLLTNKYCLKVISDKSYMQSIRAFQPDLILLDIFIDDVGDGRILCKEIKQHFSTKVVLFSAINNLEKEFQKTDADGFIKKPFDIDFFHDYISEMLR